jgi:iron complex transport system ATP-binding protein
MNAATVMRAENLGYRLEAEKSAGARWILRGVSFALEKGELCAVLGPNGIGKSTLLRLLTGAGLPAEGEVTHQGRIGYVPQAVHPALPLTALEMTLLGRAARLSLLGAPRRHDYIIAEAALRRVEAAHLASRPFNSLSGGERQLVLMARALAAEADILILDEPTAALDWHNQALILRLLAGLAEEGVTIVMSTHSPQHAFEFAHRALLIFAAERHLFGVPGEVMDEAALSGLFHLPVRRVPLADGMAAIPVFGQSRPASDPQCHASDEGHLPFADRFRSGPFHPPPSKETATP